MKRIFFLAAMAFLATICPIQQSRADIIGLYDFSNVSDIDETTSTFLAPSLDTNLLSIASDMTSPSTHNSGAVNPEFGDVFNGGIGWSARGNNPAQNFAILLPVDTFFSFSITPTSDPITYERLNVLTGVSSSIGGATAFDYTLFFSTNGTLFSEVATINSGAAAGQAATLSGNGTATSAIEFDLSSIGTQSGTVFFRLDPVASTGAAQNGVMSQRGGFIDDLSVTGSFSAVPEPTSFAGLACLAGLAFLRRSRA